MSRAIRSGRPASTWRGRSLPRPTEDLEDQGLGFDVQTVLNRRSVLRGVGLGALGMGLVACGDDSGGDGSRSTTTATGEIPDETAGPFPGDGSNGPDVLEESGIVRSDIRSSFGDAERHRRRRPDDARARASATSRTADSPFAGVAVYVWHCDREGRYSMYSEGVEDENYLRGVQIADDDGTCRSRASSPPATPAAGRTSTSRSTPTRRPSPTRPTRSPPPRSRCRRTTATRSTPPSGYEQSVANLSQVSLPTDNVFSDDGGGTQLAHRDRRRRHRLHRHARRPRRHLHRTHGGRCRSGRRQPAGHRTPIVDVSPRWSSSERSEQTDDDQGPYADDIAPTNRVGKCAACSTRHAPRMRRSDCPPLTGATSRSTTSWRSRGARSR